MSGGDSNPCSSRLISFVRPPLFFLLLPSRLKLFPLALSLAFHFCPKPCSLSRSFSLSFFYVLFHNLPQIPAATLCLFSSFPSIFLDESSLLFLLFPTLSLLIASSSIHSSAFLLSFFFFFSSFPHPRFPAVTYSFCFFILPFKTSSSCVFPLFYLYPTHNFKPSQQGYRMKLHFLLLSLEPFDDFC